MEKIFDSITVDELFSTHTSGSFPVLIDIQSDDIVWADNDGETVGDQENGHLRLINANYSVMYKGDNDKAHRYMPCSFTFSMPEENGKKVGSTSISISAIDQRIIEVIRLVENKPIAVIEAFFAKKDNTITFAKLYKYVFEMSGVTWDGVTAKWNLTFDPAMQLNVPRDLATKSRCPAVVDN